MNDSNSRNPESRNPDKGLVIVTGASRGIGRAAARAFASLGMTVLATARTESDLRSLRDETGCEILPGDVSDEDFVKRLFAETEKLTASRPFTALVNNAGISRIGLLQDMSLASWNEILRVNLTSMFLTSREAIPLFLRQGSGSIVNVSSVWGNVGASCEVAYSATKGGVNSFTRALAKELAPSGIRVNAAAFGTIDTEMNSFLDAEDRKNLEEEIGMGRFGTPEEAADLIADLALHHPYLTGQVVTMDGAWI